MLRAPSSGYSLSLSHIALEMDNSAAVVMKHYFEIVDARAAREYWEIKPASAHSSHRVRHFSRSHEGGLADWLRNCVRTHQIH